jgi:orotidine-5'-phosphate decarboxylase
MTATDAIRAGADYIVVGRPILEDENPARAAERIISEIAAAVS